MLMKSKRFVVSVVLLSSLSIRGMDDLEADLGGVGEVSTQGSLPEVPAQKPQAAPAGVLSWQVDELQDADVTTVNEERGNWFFKAKILKEARRVYEKIRVKLAKIEPAESKYSAERNIVDEKLNSFYQEYGFKSGEISSKLALFASDIKKLEDSEGTLDPEERAALADLKKKQGALEELKVALTELQKLDVSLNKALVTLGAQITKANEYDEQAWKDYEKIELVLSDEVAEGQLRNIENALENVSAIERYLDSEYKAFFEKSVAAIDEHTAKIKQQVEQLKEQGIAFGEKITDLLAKEEAAKQAAAEKTCKKEVSEQNSGWFDQLFGYVIGAWDAVKRVAMGIYDSIAGLFSATKSTEPAQVSTPVKPESLESNNPSESVALPQQGEQVAQKQVSDLSDLPEDILKN